MGRMEGLLTNRAAKVAEKKKTGTSQVPPALPPPPPPAEPKLPAEDPKKKRKGDNEGTINKDPKKPRQQLPPAQQQKLDKGKGRARSVEIGEFKDEAEVRPAPTTWSPDLRLDGAPISCQSSIRAVQQGHAHHLAEVLERPLLLPKDMETLEKMGQPQLFLSLKRDLALAIQEVFVAEKFIEDTRKVARTELEIRLETEKSLGTALAENEKLTSEVSDLRREKNGVESNLKTMKTQIEGQRKLLHQRDEELSQAQRECSDLKKQLALMKEEASSFQLSLQAAKQASFDEGVATTEEQLTEEFAALCHEYCQKVWGEALNAAGVPQSSDLRKSENVWLPLEIQEIEEAPAATPTPETTLPALPPVVPQQIPDPTEPSGSNKEKEGGGDAEKDLSQTVEPNVPPTKTADKGKQILTPFELELRKTEGTSTSQQEPPPKA
ncbi:uncharacterized protein LOC142614415 [Castanea sativa]|uniref:uncharacterized protein LOC142614415 n=1 Tax=Castanea sativa TaxID=21020 RepID=UPI003F64F753